MALVFFQIRANPPDVLFKRVRQITSDMANFQLTQPVLYASSLTDQFGLFESFISLIQQHLHS